MKYDINNDNFELLVAKFYQGKFWTNEELENDVNRIRYIKRLIGKYTRKKELNSRLILNHIIILANVFGPEFTSRILFFKLEKKYYPIIKTFLWYLNYLPEYIYTINGKTFDCLNIPFDLEVKKQLGDTYDKSII